MLEYDRIDISERIDINKINASKECDIYHYWYFLSKNFNYEPYLCNGTAWAINIASNALKARHHFLPRKIVLFIK